MRTFEPLEPSEIFKNYPDTEFDGDGVYQCIDLQIENNGLPLTMMTSLLTITRFRRAMKYLIAAVGVAVLILLPQPPRTKELPQLLHDFAQENLEKFYQDFRETDLQSNPDYQPESTNEKEP
ncbi:hypothetical protein AVDCRST_MAG81-4907 [uncultured Synechococcales cyanobacterium]|uniref:Uncharacterized protein n=1 Tax=uncultured Synechococcales cyanobacterium TaxID=1936017 RepID=A0A6J4VZE6_9CYAN|nr:hypothetical protein AVDCRST_MAG81-4907 [uncultured Synechococcales cyanobacterium]